MLPLSIKVTGRPATCILDGELALSSLGLLFALRAARQMNIWLVRRLWSLLDDKAYRWQELDLRSGQPAATSAAPGRSSSDTVARPAEMLQEWWCAWLNGDLSGHFFWVGDARHEHVLPEGTEDHLVRRFELLAHELDQRMDRQLDRTAAADVSSPLADCARDSLALAAALALESPVIFTTLSPDADEPIICSQTRAAGLRCATVGKARAMQLSESLLPPWIRPSLAQLSLAGFAGVAVHVIAPRAVALDPSLLGDDGWDERAPSGRAAAGNGASCLWDNATVFWHRLG